MITETDRAEVIRRIAVAHARGEWAKVRILRRVWADVLSEPEPKPVVRDGRIAASPINPVL